MTHIKVTKALEKTIGEIEACVDKCGKDAKLQKCLKSISIKLRKQLHMTPRTQSGGEVDPRIYNVQGMIETGRDVMESSASSAHLEHVPAPFSAGNNMMTTALMSETQSADFIPHTYETTVTSLVGQDGGKGRKGDKGRKPSKPSKRAPKKTSKK